MAAKKVDPAQKKMLEKRADVKNKIVALFVIGLLVAGSSVFLSREGRDVETVVEELEKGTDESSAGILGEATDREKELFTKVRERAQSIADDVTVQSEKMIEESKDRLEETVAEVVYSTTIKPIIDRINGLPDDQRDYIKESICRDL